ncbi:MAG: hypothetical protein GY930_18310 [bacterium]|nr:hypothetical protein [bacterium]
MRCIAPLFLILFLFAVPAHAGDPMVAKAVARIVKVETAEASMQAGDQRTGAKLTSDLNWAQKRLNAVVQNGTTEWKAANTRLATVRAKVVAKLKNPARNRAPGPTRSPNPIRNLHRFPHTTTLGLSSSTRRSATLGTI